MDLSWFNLFTKENNWHKLLHIDKRKNRICAPLNIAYKTLFFISSFSATHIYLTKRYLYLTFCYQNNSGNAGKQKELNKMNYEEIENDFKDDEEVEFYLEIYEEVKCDFEVYEDLFQELRSNYDGVKNSRKDYMYFLEAITYINPYRLKHLEIEEVYPVFLRFKYGPDYFEKSKSSNEVLDDCMEQLSIFDIIDEDGDEKNVSR